MASTTGQYDGDGRWMSPATPSSSSPMMAACVAIGTIAPVSSSSAYLRWKNSSSTWTLGIRSKLCAAGGLVVIHSRVRASHGSSTDIVVDLVVTTTLTMNKNTPS